MSQAVLCPVCNGSGEYWESPPNSSTSAPYKRVCHGCGGKGWVEVGSEPWVPSVPYYPPYPYYPYDPIIITYSYREENSVKEEKA